MPRGKLLLLLVAGLVLAGGVTTGVLLLTQKPNTPATSEGEQGKATEPKPTEPVTPTTQALNNAWTRGEKPTPALVKDLVSHAAFSPNGKWVVAMPTVFGKGSEIRVIETATWREAAVIDWSKEKEIPGPVAVTDDGKRLFMSVGNPKSALRMWDVDAKRYGERPFDLGGERVFASYLQLSPDGKTLAAYVFGDNPQRVDQIRLWDATTTAPIRTIDVPPLALGHIIFTDGGKTVAGIVGRTADWKPAAVLQEWNVATGATGRAIDLPKVAEANRGEVHGSVVTYTPDGKQAVVAGGYTLPAKPNAPDGERFPGSGSVWVIDRESGKLVKTLIDRRRDIIRDMHLTPDGKKVIVQPLLTSRLDRDFDRWGNPATPDAEFVELQQWDVATWERDWVKIVPKAERWKLWNGAAK